MRIAPLFALLLVAACAPVEGPARPATPPPGYTPYPGDLAAETDAAAVEAEAAAACGEKGGQLRPVCKMQRPMCVMPYKDAGRVCSDSSQCEGRCVGDRDEAPTGGQMAGRCEADNDPCGCTTEIIGGVPRTICVD